MTSAGSEDFNFQIGSWHVKHRRLSARLCDCQDWEEFNGTSDMRLILGGSGNVEDNVLEFPSGPYRAIALRSYDATHRTWAIWWLSSDDPHRLDVPVIGEFQDGKGTFYADDLHLDQPVKVRFLWLQTDTNSPRWEQAMSVDGGESWETNWTMNFTRA